MPGSEPADAPRARPKRIRPAPKPLKWRRAPWFGLAFIALVAGVLNALGVGKPRPAASAPAPVVATSSPQGWQAVVAPDGSYAYDVPPGWEPAPAAQQRWAGIRLVASALLGRGFCGHAALGGAGVTTEISADPETAARQAATDVAAGAYGGVSQLSPATDAQVTAADGTKVPARLVVAEVEPAATGECAAKHASVVALGTSGAVIVAYADGDRTGSPAREDLLKIVQSYRSTTGPSTTTYR